MRTHIVIDDSLVEEAMRLSGITTRRELVDQALKEFVAFRKRLDLRELNGTGELQSGYGRKSFQVDIVSGTFCNDELR